MENYGELLRNPKWRRKRKVILLRDENKIDYVQLVEWTRERQGQVIVCENIKATWLSFKPMRELAGSMFRTTEAIWSNMETNYEYQQQKLF